MVGPGLYTHHKDSQPKGWDEFIPNIRSGSTLVHLVGLFFFLHLMSLEVVVLQSCGVANVGAESSSPPKKKQADDLASPRDVSKGPPPKKDAKQHVGR